MGISLRDLRQRLHQYILRGRHDVGRRTRPTPSDISTDPDIVAESARIVGPYIAEAYSNSSRSTAAGLAEAVEILKTLESGDQKKQR